MIALSRRQARAENGDLRISIGVIWIEAFLSRKWRGLIMSYRASKSRSRSYVFKSSVVPCCPYRQLEFFNCRVPEPEGVKINDRAPFGLPRCIIARNIQSEQSWLFSFSSLSLRSSPSSVSGVFERQLCEFYKLAPIKPLRQKAKSTFLALWNSSALISSSVHYFTFRWREKQRKNFKQMSNYNLQKRNRSEFPD